MKHLKKAAAKLDDYGRNGDTIVAHINPREAALLKLLGGSASTNPKTGLLEFWDPSDPGDSGPPAPDPSTPGTDMLPGEPTPDGRPTNPQTSNPGKPGDFVSTPGESYADALKNGYAPRGFFERAFDSLGRGLSNIAYDVANNPGRTAINAGVGMIPGVGLANTLIGFANPDLTVGGLATAGGRAVGNAMGLNGPQVADKADGKTTGGLADKSGPSGDTDNEGPSSGTSDNYNPTQSGPSGSGMSPLAQALAGYGISNDGWNNWGRRKTLGAPVSSFSPYGREYTTPWDYRG